MEPDSAKGVTTASATNHTACSGRHHSRRNDATSRATARRGWHGAAGWNDAASRSTARRRGRRRGLPDLSAGRRSTRADRSDYPRSKNLG